MQSVIYLLLSINQGFNCARKAACFAVSPTAILDNQVISTIANLNSAFPQPEKHCCLVFTCGGCD